MFAQDLPRRAPAKPAPAVQSDKWSGPYMGLIAGAAIGHSSANNVVACSASGFLCDPTHFLQNGALLGATASGSTSDVAFTGGILAGYNWRLDRFVYGVESDVSYLHLSLTNGGRASSLNAGLNNGGAPPVPVVATVGTTADMNWLATFRGRIGYLASPDLLVYGTGGLALTHQAVSYSYTDNWIFNGGAVGNSTSTSNAAGYAVGGGAEWGLGRNWTLKAEYLRVGFGSRTTSGIIYVVQVPAAQNPVTSSANLNANLFRSGVSYKF
ncbi:MAG: outer membrane beta-barrel protein [Xanthobacteraceae bacterium]|nr:outer membrane beta-barrel protein [Xanthobacteraceae bacterium]